MLNLSEIEADSLMSFIADDRDLATEWDGVGKLWLQGYPADLILSRMAAVLQKADEIQRNCESQLRTLETGRAGLD